MPTSSLPEVIFLFGLSGVGKSYVGELLARNYGWQVYHADQDLTPEMLEAIQKKQLFTPEMRDRFFNIVADKIEKLKSSSLPLIVTQAAYKLKHRDNLRARISGIQFICVSAPHDVIVERLLARGDEVTPDYAARMQANFEGPSVEEKILHNTADDGTILRQFAEFCSADSK